MSVMCWEVSWFPSPEAFIAFSAFLGLLLVTIAYCLMVTAAKAQAGVSAGAEEGTPRKHQRRGSKGEDARAFVPLEFSQPLKTHCPVHPELENSVREAAHQFERTIEDLKRYLDTLSWEMPEGSDNSSTCMMAGEASSFSRVSLSCSNEDPNNSIMTSGSRSSAEGSPSPSGDNSLTSVSDVGSSSQPPLPTLVDGSDVAHASRVQSDLGQPSDGPQQYPGPATHPPCEEETASCLEAGSLQQPQEDLKIHLAAPTPPPEVPEVHSGDMEIPLHHSKGQDTLEDLIPESKLEQELCLPANADETLHKVPASAPPAHQRPEKRDVVVVPIVQDLPFLDEAVKRELEHHINKMKIQRRYGLQRRMLECEESFEKVLSR